MKVSLNSVKQYLDFELPPVAEVVERIGAQLGAVEEVENLGEKYKGIVIVKVVSCEDHPNADRLHVCKIDDGGVVDGVERDENGHVRVVCGAPNVRAGLTVAWLPPGSTVPESVGKDPFVLEARELRGVVSNGMLASPRELALGDSHEGILEIDPDEWSPNQKDIKPGADFAAVFGLDDHIIDIENKMFTHRPDCFGTLGAAREIAGILGHQFTSPEWYAGPVKLPEGSGLELKVVNEAPEKVPRLMAVAVKGVEVKPSPLWLQVELTRLGGKPINNVVDVTNYIMLLTAQPTHAYDYDKLRGHQLVARMAKPAEKITLLNHKTYELEAADIVIADGEGPIGLAGIMGGGDSEVSETTKNIVLECANFDMYTLRRSSMRHGVFTDALTRFNKGQSPLQNDHVLSLLVQSLADTAGGTPASQVFDLGNTKGREWVHPPVPVAADFINARLGFDLSANDMATLLNNVECSVLLDEQAKGLTVTAPFWRTDIETREDVVEEVGRLYGFDKLPLVLPERNIKPAAKDELLLLKRQVRETLAKSGANEVLTYSFVHGDLLTKTGQDPEHAFRVGNALSPDLQYYRLSLTPSLLEKVHPNIKAGYDQFALFEIGKGHLADQTDDDGLPREDELAALVVAADDKVRKAGAAYYEARKFLQELVDGPLGFKPVPEEMRHFDITKPFDMNRAAFVYAGDIFLGIIGEYRPEVTKTLKLPKYCAGFELDAGALLKVMGRRKEYAPLPRFPKVTQDITLKVAADLTFQELYDFFWNELARVRPASTLPMLQALDIYQREDDPAHKQITFRLSIASYEKTLTDTEVSKLLDAAAGAAREKLGAERI